MALLGWSLVALVVLPFLGGCAEPGAVSSEETVIPRVTLSEFSLGAGDEIEVMVYLHDDLTRKLRVPGSGIIFFPLVGELNVKGLGVTELRRVLTERLGHYVVDPQVNVEVTTLRSQKVYVLGEVNAPTVFPLDAPVEAVEAISKAGGFTSNASPNSVMLIRGGGTKPEVRRLNLKEFLGGEKMTDNLPLQPGDVLFVPKTFVANVDQFMKHALTALLPVLVLEQGIALYPQVQDAVTGKLGRGTTTIVVTPTTP